MTHQYASAIALYFGVFQGISVFLKVKLNLAYF